MTGVFIRRGDLVTDNTQTEEKPCEDRDKLAICWPRRAASEETIPEDTLILDF